LSSSASGEGFTLSSSALFPFLSILPCFQILNQFRYHKNSFLPLPSAINGQIFDKVSFLSRPKCHNAVNPAIAANHHVIQSAFQATFHRGVQYRSHALHSPQITFPNGNPLPETNSSSPVSAKSTAISHHKVVSKNGASSLHLHLNDPLQKFARFAA